MDGYDPLEHRITKARKRKLAKGNVNMKHWTPPKKSKRNRHTGRINTAKGHILKAGKAVRSSDGRVYRVMVNDKGHAYGMIVREFGAL